MEPKAVSVLHIIDRLGIGGAERVAVTLANLFQEKGHEVAVLTLVSKGPLSEELHPSVTQICLNRTWKWNPLPMLRLVRIARDYEIIHVHSSPNLRYVFLASFLFGLRKTIYFQEHFGNVINQKIRWHQKWIYPKTVFIAVSGAQLHWALEKMHLPVSKTFLLRSSVPRMKSGPGKPRKEGIKNILVVSNFLREKNLEFALDLIAGLQPESPYQLHLTLIGQPYDQAYTAFIRNRIHEKKLENQVRILTDCTRIQPMLPDYDLALHPSRSESGPLVLIEYMAQKLPFLCFRTGEVAAIAEQELPGWVLDDFDAGTWKKKLSAILENQDPLTVSALDNLYEKYFSPLLYYQSCLAIYTPRESR